MQKLTKQSRHACCHPFILFSVGVRTGLQFDYISKLFDVSWPRIGLIYGPTCGPFGFIMHRKEFGPIVIGISGSKLLIYQFSIVAPALIYPSLVYYQQWVKQNEYH